ncbi:iron chaperone [Actinomyces sp.]
MAIKTLDEFLATIPDDDNRERMVDVLVWVGFTFPELKLRIAWNQPMFTHHGTYIIGFSAASKHMAIAPERATMIRFEPVMRERGTDFGKKFARQPWDKPFDYELLDAFIQHQIAEKQDITSFWRPKDHELAAAEAVAVGAQPPTVGERNEDNGQLADSFLEEFIQYAENPTPGHPFEHLNDQLKQALRDYEQHPDDVYTLDEVKAELGLD